jgi:hypothetical protein
LLGILIVLSWVGVVVGSVVLAGCTLGSFVLGAGNLFFSGTCAAIGASILSCKCHIVHCLAISLSWMDADEMNQSSYVGTVNVG